MDRGAWRATVHGVAKSRGHDGSNLASMYTTQAESAIWQEGEHSQEGSLSIFTPHGLSFRKRAAWRPGHYSSREWSVGGGGWQHSGATLYVRNRIHFIL